VAWVDLSEDIGDLFLDAQSVVIDMIRAAVCQRPIICRRTAAECRTEAEELVVRREYSKYYRSTPQGGAAVRAYFAEYNQTAHRMAKRREYAAARYQRIKADPDKYALRLAAQRAITAKNRSA
jgi:hypothetical protein